MYSGNGGGLGAAYVFERDAGGTNQWGQVAKLEFPGRHYGTDVAIDGDTILVTRPGNVVTAGSADVYDWDSRIDKWTPTARLFHPQSHIDDGYAASVALSEDLAVIGVNDSVNAGAALVYGRNHGGPNNWGLLATLKSPDTGGEHWFGASTAIMDNRVLVGEFGIETLGAVYVFRVRRCRHRVLQAETHRELGFIPPL